MEATTSERELFQEGLAKHFGGEVLLDLMKCYEHVDREILVNWGQFFGYPGAYLRFSIAAYGWGRNMKWQGTYAKKVFTQRGIAVGSVAAPIELVVYLLAGIRKLKEGVPLSVISVHVDDISIARLSKDRQAVLDDMEKARDIMNKEFIHDRALCFAAQKTITLATEDSLASEIAQPFGAGTKLERSTRRLGVDHAYSNEGSKQLRVRAGRISKGYKRVKTVLRMIKGTKTTGANVYAVGIKAGQLYGAEVAKYSINDVKKAQAEAAKSARVNVIGIPSWMALGCLNPGFDPET